MMKNLMIQMMLKKVFALFGQTKLIWLALLMVGTTAHAGVTVRYQHTDSLGSVIMETNASGQMIGSRHQYQPFGQGLNGQKTGLGYTGHLEDTDLGLTYMQQRYYDPVIGRFYSNDPVGFKASNPMSFNRFLYVNNNPYKYKDPDGEWLVAVAFVVGAIAGGVNEVIKGNTDLGSVAKGAVIGGVVGATSSLGGGVIGSSIAGAVSSALGEATSQYMSGDKMDSGEIKQAAIEGGLGGALGKIGAKAVVPSRGLPDNTMSQAGNNMSGGTQRILAGSKELSTTPANRSIVEAKAGAAYGAGTSTGKVIVEQNEGNDEQKK